MLRCLAALAAVTTMVASCSFERRTEGFACSAPSECGEGRTCAEGWCVEIAGPGGDAMPVADADPNQPDANVGPDAAFVCPAECTSCTGTTCNIVCSGLNSCAPQVVCPAGIPCKVECNGEDSCVNGIDCTDASSCRIECGQLDACAGLIQCGTGVCIVECTGANSCAAGTSCADSCQCITACEGAGSCLADSTCPPGNACSNNQGDCTGESLSCNEC